MFTPKTLHNHCFQFLLGITVVLREIQYTGYANFWGETRCIMVYVKTVNSIKIHIKSYKRHKLSDQKLLNYM